MNKETIFYAAAVIWKYHFYLEFTKIHANLELQFNLMKKIMM